MRLQTLWEARWVLLFFALLAVAVAAFSAWLWWFFFLLFLFTVAFFRDPERTPPPDPNLIVAPADGTVMDIIESDESQVLENENAPCRNFFVDLRRPYQPRANRWPRYLSSTSSWTLS